MHRANETRPIMARLAAMAKRTGCAVVIVSHMSKGTAGGKAIYRALGSVDIPAASRSVLYVERNPQDEEQCVIVHVKSSNARALNSFSSKTGSGPARLDIKNRFKRAVKSENPSDSCMRFFVSPAGCPPQPGTITFY